MTQDQSSTGARARGLASTLDYDLVVQTHATRWKDADAAASYKSRPPYAPELFDILDRLAVDTPRRVLDVGCGTGKVARDLAPRVSHIDAIDLSAEMVAEGKRMRGGGAPNIRWSIGRAEETPLDPPYALIVGGESVHWMDWDIVLPRFAYALSPNGVLAIMRVDDAAPAPWREGLTEIIKRHSTQQAWRPFDMITAWQSAGLFTKGGEHTTAPFDFTQSVDDFIDAHHAMSALTRAHIDAEKFDAEIRALMAPYCDGGRFTRPIRGHIVWGKPLDPGAAS